ncbi:MAG: Asp-tRNA(Asn)/Glu-tRNA(Gln) amidotransferase subunit GatB, partial [Catalinimonas sp.]
MYEAVIGLEIHCQLLTERKLFSPEGHGAGATPNHYVSPVTLAHPGTLPRVNRRPFELAIRMGLAGGSEITRHNRFDRKNYFYPDLPKGYQLTQYQTPICRGGRIAFRNEAGEMTSVRLHQIHLEEDAGKSIHTGGDHSLLDFNRAGVPLIEVVTAPDLRSAEDAARCLQAVRRLVRYLDVCDGNLEAGSLRCDANVSVRRRGTTELGPKVEIKNLNSFRHVARAVEWEIERQTDLASRGETVVSETRLYDVAAGTTHAMRTKEALNDYRYFPDPDLPPVVVTDAWIAEISAAMPPLPADLMRQFTEEAGLTAQDAEALVEERPLAELYRATLAHTPHAKAAANWLLGPVKQHLNETNLPVAALTLRPEQLAGLVDLVAEGRTSFAQAAKEILPALLDDPT